MPLSSIALFHFQKSTMQYSMAFASTDDHGRGSGQTRAFTEIDYSSTKLLELGTTHERNRQNNTFQYYERHWLESPIVSDSTLPNHALGNEDQ